MEIIMAIVAIPKPLREKLSDEGVDSLVELLNKSDEKIKQDVITLSIDKFERRLSEEISNIRIEIGQVRSELKVEMSKNYANTIKWMFIFWVGQVGTIIGILFAFFKA